MEHYRKWSPNEEKVLAFAKDRHAGQTRIGGADYINHPRRVAEYLYDWKYRGKYTFTAFCHDLLEDTNTTAFVNDNVYHPAKHKVYHLL